MGLDCYMKHGNDHEKAFTSEDDARLKDIKLCGSMFTSGHGSDGSFRGKVYEPLIDDLMSMSDEDFHGCGIWHKSDDDDPPYVTSDELKAQAKVLEEFLHTVRDENGVFANTDNPEDESTWLDMDDDNIVYNSAHGYEYTYGEVKDLATLLGIAGKRGAIMHVWW